MELLVHVNKRLKSRPAVQLPVETLLLQYQDPAASSFLKVSSQSHCSHTGQPRVFGSGETAVRGRYS